MPDLKEQLKELQELAAQMEKKLPEVQALFLPILDCLQKGRTLFSCGNGGSATDALHIAEELVGRYRGDRVALPAVCLNADVSAMTCIANDWSFERIYSRQLEALGRPGDVLVAFSTSGNSANIIEALKMARERGMISILLTGKDGGLGLALADHTVIVPSANTARIQEIHTWILHVILEEVEAAFI
ncbi:MAG: SIS domain-containing protein [Blastochloris sp.]|nr:SIS domain-containing protein [Blastochloris sp.]